MATTFDDLKRFLDTGDLKYEAHDEHNVIVVGFGCDPEETTYRDADGDPHIQILVHLVEDGELVAVCSPRAWQLADCNHRQAVCEVATRIQADMKLIRFDLDGDDNLQPNIEVSLEKAPMCALQLLRAVAGVLLAVRRYDTVVRHAMETGIVDMDLVREEQLPAPPPDVMKILELGGEAGGLDAIERLLGGGDAPPVQS